MSDAAEAIIPLYERHAGAWLALRRRATFSERSWLDRFVACIPDESREVLDLGCGSGEPIARHLAGLAIRLTGVDSAPSMVAAAQDGLPGEEWLLADMRRLELGRRFGGVLAWDSFFHLDRDAQRAMFPVFARHARPGAALMFTSGPDDGVAIGSLEGEALHHASLSAAEYRALLAANGFAVLSHVVEDPECGGRTVWLCRMRNGSEGV
jgi:SAM-dependent methyltransferase